MERYILSHYRIINFLRIALNLTPSETNILREQSSQFINDESFWIYSDFHILIHMLGFLRTYSQIPSR